jgi:stringent starvation protein B
MVTVTAESENILNPYILRATYQWCLDFGFSPCIQANVCPDTRVPHDYVEGGMIILNISPKATHKLNLTNNDISFTGRFAGSAMEIWVPVKNVLAIFSKETGQGVTFENKPKLEQKSGQRSGVSQNESTSGKDHLVMIEPGSEFKKELKKRKSSVGKRKNSTFLKRIK